jgi:alkaline phosphatase D
VKRRSDFAVFCAKPDWTFNMLLKHGVRSCLEYAKSFDLKRARSLSNPDLAPHLEFVDLGGHGYANVRLSADAMRTEFVCIPRPITPSENRTAGPSGIGSHTLLPCRRAESARS